MRTEDGVVFIAFLGSDDMKFATFSIYFAHIGASRNAITSHNIFNPSTADVKCSRNFVISEQQDRHHQDFATCLSQMMTMAAWRSMVFNFGNFSLRDTIAITIKKR